MVEREREEPRQGNPFPHNPPHLVLSLIYTKKSHIGLKLILHGSHGFFLARSFGRSSLETIRIGNAQVKSLSSRLLFARRRQFLEIIGNKSYARRRCRLGGGRCRSTPSISQGRSSAVFDRTLETCHQWIVVSFFIATTHHGTAPWYAHDGFDPTISTACYRNGKQIRIGANFNL